jgi:nucleotide-binding universal stress UspA family protein
MGIDQKRPIPYEEAVIHWYDQVYTPVARIIRQRNILCDFPGRTEADLYLWILDHRVAVEDAIGWQIPPEKAATDLIAQSSPTPTHFLRRMINRVYDLLTPDALEFQPPPGAWRRQKGETGEATGLFGTIMVAVTGDEAGWPAVQLAATVARNENSSLNGLHIVPRNRISTSREDHEEIEKGYNRICGEYGIEAALITEPGDVTRTILQRAAWSDLLVLRLSYPPPFLSFRRIGSGLRSLIRLVRIPMMVVPPFAETKISRVLLAYGGGRKAEEALFIGAYLCARWKSELTVVTVRRAGIDERALADHARKYLEAHQLTTVRYEEIRSASPAEAVLKVCEQTGCDLILMGGYEGGYFRELIFGSTVDRVLQKTNCSVMICH